MSDDPSTSWSNWAWQAYRDGRLVEADTVKAQIEAAVAEEQKRNAGKVARLEATIRYYERRESWRARETN